jgi:hypothetical protein
MLFGGFLLNKGKHIFLSYVAHHSNFSVLCLDHIPPVLRWVEWPTNVANVHARYHVHWTLLFFSWLQHFSFFNYGYEALIVNELKDITLVDKSIADIQIPGPIILSRFGFDGQAFWKDVIYLIIYLAVTMTAAFAFLKFLVKEQR